MKTQEFEILVNKAIDNAPDWLKEDLDVIVKKANGNYRISYFISELHSRYTFGFKHIASAMSQSSDWSTIAHERLNFIDNNLDLIDYMVKKIRKSTQQS